MQGLMRGGRAAMKLDERKARVLRAVVHDFIQTAEPVGSRTLAPRYALGVSTATIRNEPAALETAQEVPATGLEDLRRQLNEALVGERMDRAELRLAALADEVPPERLALFHTVA